MVLEMPGAAEHLNTPVACACSCCQVALLASQCISTDPESRPSMAQAIDVLQNVQGLPLS